MTSLQLTKVPASNAAMLIRRPVAEVFEAFVNPDITSKFWFTKSSGRLEPGKHGRVGLGNVQGVRTGSWQYPLKRTRGSSSSGPAMAARPRSSGRLRNARDGTTFVSVSESGFTGTR